MLQDYVYSETYKRHATVTGEIVYCYREYQHAFDTVRNRVDFHESFPEVHQFDARSRTLLILDDLMTEADNSIANVFTKISHHRNVSVVFLTQNLCAPSVSMLTISCCLTIYATLVSSQHSCTTHASPVEETQQLTMSDLIWTWSLRTHHTSTDYNLSDLKYNR